MPEVGVGYISIVPEVSKISPGIAKALGEAEKTADKSGESMGSRLAGGLGTVLKTGAVAVGVAAGGVLATSLTKGMGRLSAIEGAQAKLKGLGNSAETVSGVMDNALSAVKGTAHGLDEAATVAAGVVASGIKPGKELEQVLKTVGDTAAIAGRSMSDVGTIFGSVAARGKLQGDDMLQLMSSGIPVLQLLAEEVGVTSAEISDMVTKGKIDFATFERAMRKGVGGAALEMGNTFQGALANTGAALGRFGATALTPFYTVAKDGLNAATKGIDQLEGKIKPVATAMTDLLTGRIIPELNNGASAVQAFLQSSDSKSFMAGAKETIMGLLETARGLAPVIINVASAFGQASAQLGITSWDLLVTALHGASATLQALTPPLQAVSGFMADHPSVVAAAIAAWTAFKTVPGIIDKVSGAVGPHVQRLRDMRSGISDIQTYYKASGTEMSRFGAAVQYVATSSNSTMSTMATTFNNASQSTGRFTTTLAVMKTGLAGAKTAVSGLMGALGGPWGVALLAAGAVITGFISANKALEDAQRKIAASTREAATAQTELVAAVAGSTDELNEAGQKAAASFTEAYLQEFVAAGEAMDRFIARQPLPDDFSQKTIQEQTEIKREIQATADAYEQLKTTVESMGYTMDDVSGIVSRGGSEYNNLVASLRESGDAGNLAADKLQAARDELDRIIEAARRVDPAAAQAAAGIEILADASSSASDKLNALESVMQAMGLAPVAAEEAMMDATAAVDKIVESAESANRPVEQLGENLGDLSTGKLDPTNASARDLSEKLSSMRTELEKVAIAGGDTNAAYANMDAAFKALATEFGLTEEQVRSLADAYGILPREINTAVNVDSEGVSAELAEVFTALRGLEEGQTIEVQAVGDEAMKVLDELGIKATPLADGINMELTATDDAALDALAEVSQKMHDLRDTDVDISVILDDTQLTTDLASAKALIDDLDIQEPSPQAKLIIDEFLASGEITKGDINYLSGLTAMPKADLDKALADTKFTDVNGKIADLSRSKANPKVEVQDNASGAINRIKALLWSIPKTVATEVITRTIGSNPLTRRATGGRLPTTGPGTNKRDGILGIDSMGAPLAWVDAGEWIINRKSSAQFNRTLSALNRGDGTAAIEALYNELPRHADGGRSAKVKRDLAPLDGTPYIMGGFSTRGTDCSGAVSMGVNSWVGLPIFDSRMSTVTEGGWLAAKGAKPGRGGAGDVQIGWWDRGGGANGHTAMRLADGTYIESGGNTGGGLTIGRTAGPMDGRGFTHWAHFPGGSGEGADLSIPELGELSAMEFSQLTGGASAGVSFGDADKLHELAKWYVNAIVHDTGGLLRDKGIAVNLSGKPERILSPSQTVSYDKLSDVLPMVAEQFMEASSKLETFVKAGSVTLASEGGSLVNDAKVVKDAEKGLLETRKQVADEAKQIAEAEKEIKKARKDLSKTERDNADKILDAQNRLNKAKARKNASAADIADAERNLKKVKEDVPEKSAAAAEKIAKQEEKLAELREKSSDGAKRLEAAERTVVAARYEAVRLMLTGAVEGVASGFNRIAAFFDEMSRLAKNVDDLRQARAKLALQQQIYDANRFKALQDLQLKEWDVARTRAMGAVSVAEAENALGKAREKAAEWGSTSVEAMHGAFDRFRRTGVFAVERVAESVVANTAEVRAAEWGVKVARSQAALEQLEATHHQSLAQLEVTKALLAQSQSIAILNWHTDVLKKQTAELYGMTANQATGASKAFGGIGKLVGGLGKIAGGVLAGLAGFAAGGPVGAIVGIAPAIAGLTELIQGGIDIHHNKDDLKKAWGELDLGKKIGIVLGAAGGGALNAAGGALHGHLGEVAAGAVGIGDKFLDATIGNVQYGIASKLDKIQRDSEDRLKRLELLHEKQKLELDAKETNDLVGFNSARDRLQAEVEYNKLMQRLQTAETEGEKNALRVAAELEKTRAQADKTGQQQIGELQKLQKTLTELVTVTRETAQQQAQFDQAQRAFLERLMARTSLSGTQGADYQRARLAYT